MAYISIFFLSDHIYISTVSLSSSDFSKAGSEFSDPDRYDIVRQWCELYLICDFLFLASK